MELTPLHLTVLDVLSSQSPGYLASPDASAFVAVGLDNPEVVEKAIRELEAEGYVAYDQPTVTVETLRFKYLSNGQMDTGDDGHPLLDLDENDEPQWDSNEVPTDEGWSINPDGATALRSSDTSK